MGKGVRLSEKWFRRGLWVVALVFAGFLIGLGGLVVSDLPQVESRLSMEDYIDKPAATKARAALKDIEQALGDNQNALYQTQLQLNTARRESQAARETFNNWLATRHATQRAEQDSELISRTKALDALKSHERMVQQQIEKLQQTTLDARQARSKEQSVLDELQSAAQKLLNAELRKQELRVFLYRLMLTLPLLLIAGWLFVKKRKNTYWPFVWGFIFFALFAFFVELVPYLPSYGGYVRYIVGIIVTGLIGNYSIRAFQRYQERQKNAEQMPSEKRRDDLSYEVVLSRLAKNICPSCERSIDLTKTENNFCVHCGIGLFEHCHHCNIRKSTFARFCPACGVPPAGGQSQIGVN